MPQHERQRPASREELSVLQAWLGDAPTAAHRWRHGAEHALVLWAVSMLGVVVVWLVAAWLVRRLGGPDHGLRSTAAPWVSGAAALLCAGWAVRSGMAWVKAGSDQRPALRADLAAAQVVEEHYAFDAVQSFQEPEHGGRIHFLRTTDGRVLTLDGHDGAEGVGQPGDPLASDFRPMSRLVLVRAPQSGWVISRTFSGEWLALSAPVVLDVRPEQWPEADRYCQIAWADLVHVLGPSRRA